MSGPERIEKIARFSLTTANAHELALFYERAFGCRIIATKRLVGTAFERSMDVRGGAQKLTLAMGRDIVELLQFDDPGQPYPQPFGSSDLIFQHFAIVVADMAEAYRRLSAMSGWSPISRGGPQRLPVSSGGVTAFKFRDPEGHPLEFLAFPTQSMPPHWHAAPADGPCLGIDHSAISVASSVDSIAFYEALGLRVVARSINRGPEQDRLDDIAAADVAVTALAPPDSPPHLELLEYRSATRNAVPSGGNNDIASTRLILESRPLPAMDGDAFQRCVRDPDGHRLLIVPKSGASET